MRYLLMIALTLVLSSLVVFILSEASPGDSSSFVLAEDASDAAREAYMAGTGRPVVLSQGNRLYVDVFDTAYSYGCIERILSLYVDHAQFGSGI